MKTICHISGASDKGLTMQGDGKLSPYSIFAIASHPSYRACIRTSLFDIHIHRLFKPTGDPSRRSTHMRNPEQRCLFFDLVIGNIHDIIFLVKKIFFQANFTRSSYIYLNKTKSTAYRTTNQRSLL